MLRSAAVSLVVLALTLAACSEPKQAGDAASASPDDSVVAGRIAGEKVTVGEIDAWIKDQLFNQTTRGRNALKVYEVRNRALEHTVQERTAEVRAQAETLQEQNIELDAKNQEIMRTQQQLIVQEKLASLGQLTAGIAHEIRNPLNFVNNFAQLSGVVHGETVAVMCAIDNLTKGAAGGAVQWMNRMLGYEETAGLMQPAAGWT